MKKRLISFFLSVFLLIFFSITCYAVMDYYNQGEFQFFVYYNHSVPRSDSAHVTGPLNRDIVSAVIPQYYIWERTNEYLPVTLVHGFNDCDKLQSVTIPQGITSIGEEAFMGCDMLTDISIADTVTDIGGRAFQNCISLKEFTLPDSVKTLGSAVFFHCTALEKINVPDSVTYLGPHVFRQTALRTLELPDSITRIPYEMVRDCTNLESVMIPDSITAIDYTAFQGTTPMICYEGSQSQWEAVDGIKYLTSTTSYLETKALDIIYNYDETKSYAVISPLKEVSYPSEATTYSYVVHPQNVEKGTQIYLAFYNGERLVHTEGRAYTQIEETFSKPDVAFDSYRVILLDENLQPQVLTENITYKAQQIIETVEDGYFDEDWG